MVKKLHIEEPVTTFVNSAVLVDSIIKVNKQNSCNSIICA